MDELGFVCVYGDGGRVGLVFCVDFGCFIYLLYYGVVVYVVVLVDVVGCGEKV